MRECRCFHDDDDGDLKGRIHPSDSKKAHFCLCAYTLFVLSVSFMSLALHVSQHGEDREVRLLRIFYFFIALILTLNTFI